MFLRQCFRHKDGKRRQRVVAWLGKLDEAGRLGVEQAARDASSSDSKESTMARGEQQLPLFGQQDDQELGDSVGRAPRVDHRQMGLVVGIGQVGIVLQQLQRAQHALVDDHLGGKRANIEHLGGRRCRVTSQRMAGALADDIELSFKVVPGQVVAGGNEQLLDVRFAITGGRPHVGFDRLLRDLSPADQALALLGNDLLDGFLALLAFSHVGGQEHDTRAVLTRFRQVRLQIFFGDFGQEFVRQSREDPGTVTRVRLGAASAAMLHVLQNDIGILDNLVASFAFNVCDETNSTTVFFIRRIVQPLPCGETELRFFFHVLITHPLRSVGGSGKRASDYLCSTNSWFFPTSSEGGALIGDVPGSISMARLIVSMLSSLMTTVTVRILRGLRGV